jgi:hypothetical protein
VNEGREAVVISVFSNDVHTKWREDRKITGKTTAILHVVLRCNSQLLDMPPGCQNIL